MRNSFAIAKNFILQLSKSKINILIYVLLPPALAVLFMLLMSSGSTYAITVGVNDMDDSQSSKHIIEYLNNSNNYDVVFFDQKDNLVTSITEKNVRAGIVIPKGFEEQLMSGNIKEIEMYSIEGVSVLGWLDSFVNQKVSGIDKIARSSQYYEILNDYVDNYIKLEVNEITDISNKSDASQNSFGMYIFASIFSIWGICGLAFKEKIYKTYQRILTTPVKRYEFAIGNILSCLFFALLHMAISIPIIYSLFDMSIIIPVQKLVLIMLCLYIAAISLGTLLVSFAKSQSSMVAINVLILTITSMLGGCYWPIEFMPKFMQNIGKVTPQYWFMNGIEKLIKDKSILLNVVVLIGCAIIYILIYLLTSKFKKDEATV